MWVQIHYTYLYQGSTGCGLVCCPALLYVIFEWICYVGSSHVTVIVHFRCVFVGEGCTWPGHMMVVIGMGILCMCGPQKCCVWKGTPQKLQTRSMSRRTPPVMKTGSATLIPQVTKIRMRFCAQWEEQWARWHCHWSSAHHLWTDITASSVWPLVFLDYWCVTTSCVCERVGVFNGIVHLMDTLD